MILRQMAICLVLCAMVFSPAQASTIYVDDDAAIGGDGLSWATAYDDLQLALDAAKAPGSTVDEIRVGGGIYKPSVRADPSLSRTKTFQLINGVAIRGGYRGCPGGDCGSGDPDERDIVEYETIFSGDLNGDDGPNFENNGENSYHVFYHPEELALDETAVLDGCTITGGNANGGTYPGWAHDNGGGIYNESSSPTITDCTITGNSVEVRGGGLYCSTSNPTITDCTIANNSAHRGGGIYSLSSGPVIIGCLISDNTAEHVGGGVYCYSSNPTITNCTITRNTGTSIESMGSGIYCTGDKTTITNCTITSNIAAGEFAEGGGIYCRYGIQTITNCTIADNIATWAGGGVRCSNAGNAIITDCTITNNAAGYQGSGVCCDGSDPTIVNCTISNNKWSIRGGGILSAQGNPTITGCIISNNTAYLGGGFYCRSSGTPTITNCTIANNTANTSGAIHCRDSNPAITNSILWGNAPEEIHPSSEAPTIIYSNIEGGWEGEGNINAEPGFAFSNDYHLIPSSPCIDVGTNSPSGGLSHVDIDGNPRPLDGNGGQSAVADMGAFEYNPGAASVALSSTTIKIVTPLGGPNPENQVLEIRNCGGGTLTWDILEDCAWLEADPPSGSSTGAINTISCSVNTTGMEHGEYECLLTIVAPGAVNGPREIRVILYIHSTLHVPGDYDTIQEALDASVPSDVVLVADGIYTGPGNKNLDFGGKAIVVRSENGPEHCIIDCEGFGRGFHVHRGEGSDSGVEGFTIRNGHVDTSSPGGDGGGGISCISSSPTITNCIISNNAADDFGGGIYCRMGSHPTITNCTITNNTADEGGGGVRCWLRSSPTITSCTIANNSTVDSGGGIYFSSCSPTITNCSITNNSAGTEGGGIYCRYSGSPTITSCTIANNAAGTEGGGIYCGPSSSLTVANCILWGDVPQEMFVDSGSPTITYTNIEGGWEGEGNIDADPLFVQYPDDGGDGWGDDPDTPDVDEGANDIFGDLHLTPFSPCIDAGDPASDFSLEPEPDGGRVNMGAYGNTPEATSKAGLGITGYGLVSRARVGRTVFAYELTVTVHNSSDSAVGDVVLTLLDMPDNVTIGDEPGEDTVDVGPIAAGATVTSVDTFKIIVDRTVPVSSLAISWSVAFTVDGESGEYTFTAPLSGDDLDGEPTPGDDGEPEPGDDDELDVDERFDDMGRASLGAGQRKSAGIGDKPSIGTATRATDGPTATQPIR